MVRGRRTAIAALAGSIVFITTMSADAAVRRVDNSLTTNGTGGPNWSDAFNNLPSALSGASAGDEIWVKATTTPYKPASQGSSFDITVAGTSISNQFRVLGGFAGNETAANQRNPAVNVTILSGDISGNDSISIVNNILVINNVGGVNSYQDNCNHVVTFGSATTVHTILDGFTIRGARGTSGGGAVVVKELSGTGGKPTIRGCTIKENWSTTSGGGIFCENNTEPTFRNCTFSANLADVNGGGIYTDHKATVLNCRMSQNAADDGGAIYSVGGATLSIISSEFHANSATVTDGGAVAVHGTATPALVVNSLFVDNFAKVNGGGIFTRSNIDIVNCTFSGNHADEFGGGSVLIGTTCNVTNCIYWDNSADLGDPQIAQDTGVTVSYSDVQGGWSGAGTNIQNVNPLFVATGNFRLQATSLCKDAGLNSSVPADALNVNEANGTAEDTPDRDLLVRIRNSVVDQGAYELHISECCGDANSNGVVNIDDLVLVITGWGVPSLGDVAYASGTCGSNGTTNIDDLVTVIANWGNCDGSPGEDSMPQSIDDCMDYADGYGQQYDTAWIDAFEKCKRALCEAQLIDCD